MALGDIHTVGADGAAHDMEEFSPDEALMEEEVDSEVENPFNPLLDAYAGGCIGDGPDIAGDAASSSEHDEEAATLLDCVDAGVFPVGADGAADDMQLTKIDEPAAPLPPPAFLPFDELPRDSFRFELPNGTVIIAYPGSLRWEAVCNNPKHGKCIMTRTMVAAHGNLLVSNPFQGRPLGLMAYFCFTCKDYQTRAQHQQCVTTQSMRTPFRPKLRELPGSQQLFWYERGHPDEEPDYIK